MTTNAYSFLSWLRRGIATGITATPGTAARAHVTVELTASGTPIGGEFQVNSYTTSYQRYPEVAADGAGNFVVAWLSGGSAGSVTCVVSSPCTGVFGSGSRAV